jgi:tetratricopeptide (TPR) repeat protein
MNHRRKKMKKTFLCAGILAAALLLSCATYGVGGGYTSRSTEAEAPTGRTVNLTDKNTSLYLNGSYKYFEALFAFHKGTVSTESGAESYDTNGVSTGWYFKYPFVINQFFSPLLLAGSELQAFYDEKAGVLWKQLDEYETYTGDFTLIKIGGGFDLSFSRSLFLQGRLYYAPPILGKRSDLSFSLGLGYRTALDGAKANWKTRPERIIETAKKYYSWGEEAYANKDWDTAIAGYTRAIGKNPDYKEAYHGRGWAYLYTGDSALAEDDFNEVLRIDPSNRAAKDNLMHTRVPHAAFLLYMEGNDAAKTSDDLAIEKYTQAIALAPGYSVAYNNRGVMYLRKKMYDEAEADFRRALESDSENYSAYANLGTVYKNRGNYDTAEQYLNRALEIYPAHAYAQKELKAVTDARERAAASARAAAAATARRAETAASLPSEMALPSWVKGGITEREMRNRKGGAPAASDGNIHAYAETRSGKTTGYGFYFSDTGSGLYAYSVFMPTSLNTVLDYFRKTTGDEPVTGRNDAGESTYTWVVPLEVRADILLLRVTNSSTNVLVSYYFVPVTGN